MSRMIWHRRADAESGMSPDTFRSRAKAPRPPRRSQSRGGRAKDVHRTRARGARIVVRTNKKDGRVLPGAGRGCTLFWPLSVVKQPVSARRRGAGQSSEHLPDQMTHWKQLRSQGVFDRPKLLRGFCDSPTNPESTLGPWEGRRGAVARQSEKRKKHAH